MSNMTKNKAETHRVIEPRWDVVERARLVSAGAARRARIADQQRELSPETINDLRESGLLTLTIPRDQGGIEADLVTQLAVYELLGGACTSTAWILGNHSTLCTFAMGMMAERSQRLIKTVVESGATIAHAAAPGGVTQPVAGGFVSSGRWRFVSGSNIAGWIFLNTLVPGPSPNWEPSAVMSQPPKCHTRWLVLPASQPGLRIEDTWQAMSARASMSNDVVMEDVFVPEEHAPVDNRPAPHQPWLPDGPPALRVPSRSRVWMPAMMLGIAQVALDDTIESAKAESMSQGGHSRRSMPGNQFAVADAAMAIESARAFLYQETRAIAAKADAEEQFTSEDAARFHMAGLVARENAQKAVDRMFSVRGARGLFEASDFERYYRDVRMGTLHALTTPDLVREEVGKHLLGIPMDVQPRWG